MMTPRSGDRFASRFAATYCGSRPHKEPIEQPGDGEIARGDDRKQGEEAERKSWVKIMLVSDPVLASPSRVAMVT